MAVQLYMALYRAFHAQKNRLRPSMPPLGLSPGQPKVLRHLTRQDGCMQKDIAEALDIEPATVSQLLTNMAQKGLIRRSAPPERRRAEAVYLTPQGREVYEKWERICLEVESAALEGFTGEEREQFIGYLSRLYRNLSGKPLE